MVIFMNFGMILIWIAGACGILAFLTSLLDCLREDRKFKMLSEKLELVGGAGIVASLLLLTSYLLYVKTEYSYVFQHSSSDLVWYYRFSALWAGQEGSFLLWTGFIFIMMAATRYSKNGKALRDTKLLALTRTTALFVASVFLVLIILKNPFSMYQFSAAGMPEITYWNPFAEPFLVPYGQGMNPLLRNPWMAIHPPVLFLGYAAFTLPFSAAVAGLILNDKRWPELASTWMRAAWLFLTLGIGFGGFWAYEVLGWGAWYWSWDPVETSSLIPWLSFLLSWSSSRLS